MKWTADFYPLRQLTQREQRRVHLKITAKDFSSGRCIFCSGDKFDNCYNCEKPMCENHSIPFVMLADCDGQPIMVLNVCPECVRDNGLEQAREGVKMLKLPRGIDCLRGLDQRGDGVI